MVFLLANKAFYVVWYITTLNSLPILLNLYNTVHPYDIGLKYALYQKKAINVKYSLGNSVLCLAETKFF